MTSALWSIVLAAGMAAPADPSKGRFEYDSADETVHAAMIGGEGCYDPQVVAVEQMLWLTWLEFEPGKGDRIWVGSRDVAGGNWISRKRITPEPGMYRNPTLTPDRAGGFWLTFEQGLNEKWTVAAVRLEADGSVQEQLPAHSGIVEENAKAAEGGQDDRIPKNERPDAGLAHAMAVGAGINHRVAAAPNGGAWVVWQTPEDGRFKITIARLTEHGPRLAETISSLHEASAWEPAIALRANGDPWVVFDACETPQGGFDTYVVQRIEGRWRQRVVIGSNSFEGRARLACGHTDHPWMVWEEGNECWGGRYVPHAHKNTAGQMDISDANGPLHAFRKLHVALLSGQRFMEIEPALPMEAFEKLADRRGPNGSIDEIGGYYEGGELAVDGIDRLWIVYRHDYAPWIGVERITHTQQDWGVYARCFDGRDWSKLFRCDIGQGDGMQRLSVTPLPDGIALAYATGRTDRRNNTSALGMACAVVRLPGGTLADAIRGIDSPYATPVHREDSPTTLPTEYQVFFGDLHRHTDLSLCNVPIDGTMEDAYRYAIDVAHLDFMGITDHSRDIAQGNAKSLLWWRCIKEVSRHDLTPRFIPMYAYEHSRNGEDHNVVSLRPKLWPDSMPFPELWKQMDNGTFSIPHQTICQPIPPGGPMPLGLDEKTWTYGDEAHRRLMEIYQGCRDRSIERDAYAAFAKGHIMGFIASSDHLSTSASYAGVWAKERTRESIFRALQARRTFGATDRIAVKMTMGPHWMGEQVPAAELGRIHVEADGTSSIESLELIVDGRVVQRLPQDKPKLAVDIAPPELPAGGVHYFFVRLQQSDGNRAWGSPIWISH